MNHLRFPRSRTSPLGVRCHMKYGEPKMTQKNARLGRPRHVMPKFVKEALEERGLMDAYEERPAYQQNDYVGWINEAKRPDTKEKRLKGDAQRTREGRPIHEHGARTFNASGIGGQEKDERRIHEPRTSVGRMRLTPRARSSGRVGEPRVSPGNRGHCGHA